MLSFFDKVAEHAFNLDAGCHHKCFFLNFSTSIGIFFSIEHLLSAASRTPQFNLKALGHFGTSHVKPMTILLRPLFEDGQIA